MGIKEREGLALLISLTRGACDCNDDKVIFENPPIYSAGDVLELLLAGRCVSIEGACNFPSVKVTCAGMLAEGISKQEHLMKL